MIIPFGEWAPDNPVLGNAGSPTIKNVVPDINGYKKLGSLTPFTSALTAYARGIFSGIDGDLNVHAYSGDETSLYRVVDGVWTDSSSATYTTGAESYWEFAQYNNEIVATNYEDAIQTLSLGDTAFADLTGSPPQARHVAVVKDHLVVGNTTDVTDGNIPYRVRFPGIGTITSWTISAATQADYQDLKNGGVVQQIVGGEIGYIFMLNTVYRMAYIGSPQVFQFDAISESRGALAPRSVVKSGEQIFYLADDGFYMLAGGVSYPIGVGKVNRTFLNDLNLSYLWRVTAAADPKFPVIYWSYPSNSSATGTPDKVLMYNWAAKKFCFAEFNHELIGRMMSVGVTLDGLDALFASIDDVSPSLDSSLWKGGKLQLIAFNTDHKTATFDGTALNATLETGEKNIVPSRRSEVTNSIPLVDGGTHTVQAGTRETQSAAVSWGSVSTENDSGYCPLRSNSRYHRFRVNVSGDFTDAIGIDIPDENIVGVGSR